MSYPMHDVKPQQVHHYHPEPYLQLYNNHTILPPSRNFDPRYLPENHGRLPYMITHYNGIPTPGGAFSVSVNHDHDHGVPYMQGYQVVVVNRNSAGFIHPPGPHLYHPQPLPVPSMPPVQAQNMDVLGPRFVGPSAPTGLRLHELHRREMLDELTPRHHSTPHLRPTLVDV
nr:hypothetical protein [Tanacetum cinerariifolium]